MRTPEQQVTPNMWRLWQLGSFFHWFSNLKDQIERSPEAVYFIKSQGKCGIQLPSALLGRSQKLSRGSVFDRGFAEVGEGGETLPPITHRTINLTFPTVSLRRWRCCVSSTSRISRRIVWKGTVKLSGEPPRCSSLSNCCGAAKDYETRLSKRGLLLSEAGTAHVHRACVVFWGGRTRPTTSHPRHKAAARTSFVDTCDPIAGMIRKGTLWKYRAKFIPSVIPVGLCQEQAWPKGWIIGVVTQSAIYF